jgi:acetyltransferase-like isoleucine patch superfamily enzyme
MSYSPSGTWAVPTINDGTPTIYGWVVRHPKNFRLGFGTDIGYGTYIQALHGVTIEENVQIGSHCSIYSVSTINDKKGAVWLRKGCRIGSHSVIMPGVTVGENATVGAFSYITHDVPANTIVYPKQELIVKNRELI